MPSLMWSLALLSHKLERRPPSARPQLTYTMVIHRIGRDVQDKIGRIVERK